MDVEKENTFRALKDEELLVTSFWCRVGWHTWEHWSAPYLPSSNASHNIQHRYCCHCGKAEVRRISDFV